MKERLNSVSGTFPRQLSFIHIDVCKLLIQFKWPKFEKRPGLPAFIVPQVITEITILLIKRKEYKHFKGKWYKNALKYSGLTSLRRSTRVRCYMENNEGPVTL